MSDTSLSYATVVATALVCAPTAAGCDSNSWSPTPAHAFDAGFGSGKPGACRPFSATS